MDRKKRSDLVFSTVIISSLLFVLIIHWFFGLPVDRVEVLDIEEYPVDTIVSSGLKLMSYNIHYGKGDLEDNDFPVSKEKTLANLDGIIKLVKDLDVDVLAVQEIDFYAKRSSYIDEVDYIARNAGFRYAARAIDWDVKYVPFPYWPPARHFGRVKSGVAVFSKYPIVSNVKYVFNKPADNSWYYNLFYLDRLSQAVVIDVNGIDIALFNNHLEAFDKHAREDQARILSGIVNNLTYRYVIVLGDLNAVPPEAIQKRDFPDEPKNDYVDRTILTIRKDTSLHGVSDELDKSSSFTFPSYAPNRKLDYIFVSSNFKVVDKQIISGGDLSDHLPIYTHMVWS